MAKRLLDGKVALVTGAARGLGMGIARSFCEAGARVLLTDVLVEGEATAADLRSEGHDAHFILHDVTQELQWQAAVETAIGRWGALDALVNNAGINLIRTVEEATVDELRRILEVNLVSAFTGIKAVIPAMTRKGGGTITNIASNTVQKMFAQAAIYSSSKAALCALTKTSAIHLAASNIRVNAILPGVHATEMMLGQGRDAPGAEFVDQICAIVPMRRLGEPREIGETAVFLASDMASYITAAEIVVDGGAAVT